MDTATLPNLFDFDRNGLRALFVRIGGKPYRADQGTQWMYARRVADCGQMTDAGKALRAKLAAHVGIESPNTLFEKQCADGTHRWLLGMDGGKAVETVFMPEAHRGTLCVSAELGCAV